MSKKKRLTIKESIFLAIELLILIFFVARIFLPCSEYNIESGDFESSNNEYFGDLKNFKNGSVGIESENMESQELMNCSLKMKSGAYKVTVKYDSVVDKNAKNLENSAGNISFSTQYSKLLKANDLVLNDTIHKRDTRVWLRMGSGTTDVKISVNYSGTGKLAIKSILFTEKRTYRIITFLGVLFFFILLDSGYYIFCKNKVKQETKYVVAGILTITLFSAIPLLGNYIIAGDDLTFHLQRITGLADAIKEHQFPDRIEFHVLNGYGYANPLFYGEIFLTLPALLYCFYVPLNTCYLIYVLVVNLATAIICFYCLKKMFGDWKKSLFGAALYTVSAYRLTNVIVRAAVGEYTAMTFLPLLVYGMWKIYTKDKKDKIKLVDCIPLIISATGIIQSHVLTCEMVLIFVVPFVLFNRRTYRKNVILAFLKSIVSVILINMWFIIPFLQSMRMDVSVNHKNEGIEWRSLSLGQIFDIFQQAKTQDFTDTGRSIGLSLICITILFIWLCFNKKRWNLNSNTNMKYAQKYMIGGFVAIFFTSTFCKWDSIAHMGKIFAKVVNVIQFPWRFLAIVTVFMTFAAMYIIKVYEEKESVKTVNLIMGIICGAIIISEGYFMHSFIVNQTPSYKFLSGADNSILYVSGGEYILTDVNRDNLKSNEVLTDGSLSDVHFRYDTNGTYLLRCINEYYTESYADVPVQMYDNYHAYRADTGEELKISKGDNSRMRVTVPEGFSGYIKIKYVVPKLWRICELISLISVFAIIAISAFELRRFIVNKKAGKQKKILEPINQ